MPFDAVLFEVPRQFVDVNRFGGDKLDNLLAVLLLLTRSHLLANPLLDRRLARSRLADALREVVLIRSLKDSNCCFYVTIQKLLVDDFIHIIIVLGLGVVSCLQVVEKLEDFYSGVFPLLLSLTRLLDVRKCGPTVDLLFSLKLRQAVF